jgi:hypothetical protein
MFETEGEEANYIFTVLQFKLFINQYANRSTERNYNPLI